MVSHIRVWHGQLLRLRCKKSGFGTHSEPKNLSKTAVHALKCWRSYTTGTSAEFGFVQRDERRHVDHRLTRHPSFTFSDVHVARHVAEAKGSCESDRHDGGQPARVIEIIGHDQHGSALRGSRSFWFAQIHPVHITALNHHFVASSFAKRRRAAMVVNSIVSSLTASTTALMRSRTPAEVFAASSSFSAAPAKNAERLVPSSFARRVARAYTSLGTEIVVLTN
jgi:hypothetical protein